MFSTRERKYEQWNDESLLPTWKPRCHGWDGWDGWDEWNERFEPLLWITGWDGVTADERQYVIQPLHAGRGPEVPREDDGTG